MAPMRFYGSHKCESVSGALKEQNSTIRTQKKKKDLVKMAVNMINYLGYYSVSTEGHCCPAGKRQLDW